MALLDTEYTTAELMAIAGPPRQAAPAPARRQPAPQVRFANDRDALIRTVLGEAGAEPPEGQTAVAAVVLNRARQRGLSPSEVVLERNQFEPWGNPQTAARLMSVSPNDPAYQAAARQVDAALQGQDPTNGADHFYAPRAQAALGRDAPGWAQGDPLVIGGHNFYSLGGSTEDARQSAAAAMPDYTDEELKQIADGVGAADQQPIEVTIDQGVVNKDGRAMLGDQDLGPWNSYWASRNRPDAMTDGYRTALEQERQLAQRLSDRGQGVGFTDQLTAPFNDELAGIAGYLTQGAGNIGRQLTGQKIEVSAMERARAAADVASGQQDQYAKDNPLQSLAGNVLGGFAFAPARGVGAVGTAASFLRPTVGQAYRGAAATGALYGAADAQGGLSSRLGGAAAGAGLGVATAGLIDGATRLIPRTAPWNAQVPLPREQARVGSVIDRQLRRAGITPQELSAALTAAPEGALPLNVGEGVLAPAAEALAQNPGPGARIVRDALQEQQRGTADRFRSRVGEGLGGEGNYFATLDNAIAQRRDAAGQVMSQIEGRSFNLSPDTVTALRSDIGQRQIRQAAQYGLASPDPLVRENAANLNRLADTLLDNPGAATLDLRSAQNVSKALLDASSEAWRQGNGAAGQAFGDIGRAVRNNAKDAIPEYQTFLKRYGEDSDNIQALEMGRQLFRSADDASPDGMSAEVLRKQFDELSDTGKDLFRKGVGEAIVARAQTTRGDLGAMRDLIRSGEYADRIRIAFPDEKAFTRFLNAAEAEVQMANTANSILNGSPTARRQQWSQELGGQAFGDQTQGLMGASLPGMAMEAGRRTVKGIGNAIGQNRSILRNDALNETLARALTEPQLLQRMLNRPARRGLFGGRVPAGVAGSVPLLLPNI